jgi:hypothetical protein
VEGACDEEDKPQLSRFDMQSNLHSVFPSVVRQQDLLLSLVPCNSHGNDIVLKDKHIE